MNLDDAQKQVVTGWIESGLKLSEIQSRLASELGLKLTYMEVRFLVDDLKLVPKDPEPAKPSPLATGAAPPSRDGAPMAAPDAPAPAPPVGGVRVTVDTLARPGALASGNVTFSDGQSATWYLDEMGRLGLAAKTKGYRPPAGDVPEFQAALEAELSKLGM